MLVANCQRGLSWFGTNEAANGRYCFDNDESPQLLFVLAGPFYCIILTVNIAYTLAMRSFISVLGKTEGLSTALTSASALPYP